MKNKSLGFLIEDWPEINPSRFPGLGNLGLWKTRQNDPKILEYLLP